MRLVIDTNILVAALLTPRRAPDRALSALRERGSVVLYDARIEREYREVLARPKFRAIDPAASAALLDALLASGERVHVAEPYAGAMHDADDRCFVEVALAGRADALLTGNARHFATGLGFDVLDPAALLARLGLA